MDFCKNYCKRHYFQVYKITGLIESELLQKREEKQNKLKEYLENQKEIFDFLFNLKKAKPQEEEEEESKEKEYFYYLEDFDDNNLNSYESEEDKNKKDKDNFEIKKGFLF